MTPIPCRCLQYYESFVEGQYLYIAMELVEVRRRVGGGRPHEGAGAGGFAEV